MHLCRHNAAHTNKGGPFQKKVDIRSFPEPVLRKKNKICGVFVSKIFTRLETIKLATVSLGFLALATTTC